MNENLGAQDDLNTFWGHTEELRKTIIQSLFFILVSIVVALFFYQDIFNFIQKPLKTSDEELSSALIKKELITNNSSQNKFYKLSKNTTLLKHSENSFKINDTTFKLEPKAFIVVEKEENIKPLVILSPIDGMTTVLKVAFFVGLFVASPAWGFLILRFLAPALTEDFKKLLIPFLFSSFLFIILGFSFAFFITIPIANNYLFLFNENIGTNFWTLSNYIDYTLFLALGNGLSFESSVIAIFLVHYGLLSSRQMQNKRRHFIVTAFIVSALLTPPDVLTQVMLAIPLIILYEFIILYAKSLEKKRGFKKPATT